MKYTNVLLSIILGMLPYSLMGQSSGRSYTITGTVQEASTGSALEFATISIFDSRDSSLITGEISDAQGIFRIDGIQKGSYYALVEFIGFETTTVDDIVLNKDIVVDLGMVVLQTGGIALDEIEITAEKSELQFALDKRVFNVGKDLSSKGGSAQDLLDNIPSVTVGVEGEVNLRGSSNVRILVNGRPSGLVGISNTDGLRSIPSHMIERVEVITNPSSKYEAEGMAGIINIVLKKDRKGGFNGAFEVSGGYPVNYGLGANINYRKDRFNWFANYNFKHHTSPSNGSSYQEFYKEDITNVSLQKTLRDRMGDSHSIRLGSDYFITEKQILTGAFLYRYSLDNNDNHITYRDTLLNLRPTAQLDPTIFTQYKRRNDIEIEEEPTLEYSLRYENNLGKKHKLSADVAFQQNNEKESSDFTEAIYNSKDVLLKMLPLEQRSRNNEGEKQWRLQMDYERPLNKGMKMETGALGTFRTIDNDYRVENKENNEWKDTGLSNNFIYEENVLAAYANIGQELEKWSYQLGLRGEYSDIVTTLVNTNEVNPRTYFNVFPSAFVNYALVGNNKLQVSYSKRIRRPGFFHLNPFFTYTDPRNYFGGNPNLNPEFTDSFELGHLKYWETANIGTTVYYRRTTDLIQRIQSIDAETQTTKRIPENIGIEDNYGLEFVFAYTGIKWLRLDGSVNGFKYIISGQSDQGQDLSAESFSWLGSTNARFSFWSNANLQLRMNYRAPRKTVQGRRKGAAVLNMGFSKDFLDDKMTLTLSVKDVFNNSRWRFTVDEADYFQERDYQRRPRVFTATLSYRINMKKPRGRGSRGGRPSGGGEGF